MTSSNKLLASGRCGAATQRPRRGLRAAGFGPRSRVSALIAVATFVAAPFALAAPKLPQPTTHVADYANVIDAASERQIDGWLTELEQKTGAQVVVLTVDTTHGQDIESFTLEVGEQWKLGRRGVDNGVLVCMALKERRARVEVGYGLEGVLPDVWCHRMEQQFFVPNFKRGDYARGLLDGAVAIANQIADSQSVQLSGVPATRVRARGPGHGGIGGTCSSLFFILIIIALLSGWSRRRGRYYRTWGGGGLFYGMLLGSMLGGMGRRSSWGGGFGGFGGGGFGGGSFGGGGGGSFGGGGASCGW
jgi:uncharacterized protein